MIQHESDSPAKSPQEPINQNSNNKSNELVDSIQDDDGEYEEINDEDLRDDENIIQPDPRI